MDADEIDILRAQNKALMERVEELEEQLEEVRAFVRYADEHTLDAISGVFV